MQTKPFFAGAFSALAVALAAALLHSCSQPAVAAATPAAVCEAEAADAVAESVYGQMSDTERMAGVVYDPE